MLPVPAADSPDDGGQRWGRRRRAPDVEAHPLHGQALGVDPGVEATSREAKVTADEDGC